MLMFRHRSMFFKKTFLKFFILSNLLFSSLFVMAQSVTVDNSKLKWTSEIPKFASDPEKWVELIEEFKANHLNYAVLAAGIRMLLFFEDVKSKKYAYETIISVIDMGYPNSLFHLFIIGNIETEGGDEFSQNYNFYKAVVNKMREMDKWAGDYFLKVDAEKLAKYKLYQSIQLYGEKKYKEASDILVNLIKGPLPLKDYSFVKKVVRTLARYEFEQLNYQKSLMYYDDFLLKTNPITPTDWLEKAWNLYYLKRYEDTLGTLYNLEAGSADRYKSFEKYIIRASIYLNFCATDNVKKLVENFETEYKSSIDGIINGKQLSTLKDIEEIAQFSNPRYKQAMDNLHFMSQEREIATDEIGGDLVVIMNYLFDTEIKVLRQLSRFYKEKAMNKAALDLTMLNESLRFLQFGTEREKYNPAVVFRPREELDEVLVDQIDLADRGFLFQWKQQGQFWRDERNKYKGPIKNQCDVE